MIKFTIGPFMALTAIVFAAMGCGSSESDSSKIPQKISLDQLTGHWELANAKRDGKSTRVLDNTFFEFTRDSMQTNFPSKEGRYKYEKLNNEIVTREDSPTFYTIQFLEGDTMTFSVDLRGYLFEMTLISKDKDKSREDS
ncbi:MAG: hypothetical protein GVX78_01010 [Bacteroidetes bacterium]|jgi:hypothetical protein|nr:hypothetical protein [Bacteroidota bacterium]